ncbi:DNA topoisomerase III [uncultured Selenomonas sp.]|uniref:DNA topoisomerase III n=1 Tax=uncultured Selenomonas sp. TaxID=159275 RepID=UPI0028D0C7E4|nr:DNA topoisomerase III [uncultured Selenomonas sp.]
MSRLFIAEKPSMGRAIAQGLEALGNKSRSADGCIHVGSDTVTWLFGHILEQYSPDEYDEKYKRWHIEDLPIVPSVWKLKVKPDAKKQYKIVSALAKEADEIIHAGDPDREGQLLVDELLAHIGVLKTKPVKRILLNALDVKSVQEALRHIRPNDEFVGLRNSALARSRADWLIGMNLSRIYTILARSAGYDSVVNVGRVKTPTMGLVVRREIEIRTFKPVTFFTPQVEFSHANGTFRAKWKAQEQDGVDEEGRILKKDLAEEILTSSSVPPAKIESVEQKKGTSPQRLPYSLSALQIDAGKIFGYSPQEVLDTQQALYEKKLTSYPRSDCDYLPENQLSDAAAILKNLAAADTALARFVEQADLSIKSRAWNDKKISAHHAIVPTTVETKLSDLSEKEKNLYMLIAKSYIAQFYPAQEFLSTKVELSAGGEMFTASGKVILQQGWKSLYQNDAKDDEEEQQSLPDMQQGDSVEFAGGKIVEGVTKPPARFTPATLLKAMKEIHKYVHDKELAASLKECSGIGTEATRAGMIDELEKRGFIKKAGKNFVPTEIASSMCRILPESLIYPDLTARWEDALDKIGKKEMSLADFGAQQKRFLDELLAGAKEAKIPPPRNLPLCPACKKPLRRRKSKKGTWFWSCSGYPDCTKAFADERGKPGKEWTFTKK